jgi:polysaccharide biosynthesis/export protein
MHILFSGRKTFGLFGLGLILLLVMLGSCANTRQLTYMQGKFDTAQLSKVDLLEPIIRKGDILSIIVYSDNPAATALFNQPQAGSAGGTGTVGTSSGGGGGGSSSGGSAAASGSSSGGSSSGSGGGSPGSGGYLVDEKGNIEFQEFGVLHVDGVPRSVLKDTLETRLRDYLKNPYVTIRFLNYRFTMLGEIARPGVMSFPGEHLNLLEALGLGGDLTFYGRRDNILVIRENNGKREFARLDVTKPEVMASPFFYLQPNDVVYIEANRKKVAANDQSAIRAITLTTAVISTLAILYTLFKQ